MIGDDHALTLGYVARHVPLVHIFLPHNRNHGPTLGVLHMGAARPAPGVSQPGIARPSTWLRRSQLPTTR